MTVIKPWIAYCTNVHAGWDLDDARSNLERYSAQVCGCVRSRIRKELGSGWPNRLQSSCISISLNFEAGWKPMVWKSAPSMAFLKPIFINRSQASGLHATLVGGSSVSVHESTHSTLDGLLPEGQTGSISTLPIAGASRHRPSNRLHKPPNTCGKSRKIWRELGSKQARRLCSRSNLSLAAILATRLRCETSFSGMCWLVRIRNDTANT